MAKKNTQEVLCPHCHHALDPDYLRENVARLISYQRRSFNGAPMQIYACGCGALLSAREMREHKCDVKPARGKEVPAGPADRQKYLTELARRRAVARANAKAPKRRS
jgi:hypothetical protein